MCSFSVFSFFVSAYERLAWNGYYHNTNTENDANLHKYTAIVNNINRDEHTHTHTSGTKREEKKAQYSLCADFFLFRLFFCFLFGRRMDLISEQKLVKNSASKEIG